MKWMKQTSYNDDFLKVFDSTAVTNIASVNLYKQVDGIQYLLQHRLRELDVTSCKITALDANIIQRYM